MQLWRPVVYLLLSATISSTILAQKIVYSEPDRDDSRRMNFEVIGKIGPNFQIYKNVRNRNYVTLYDNDMKEVTKIEHEYMPDDRLINVDFFPFSDFSYMIYQYQKRNVVYCMAAKIDASGNKVGDVIELDTSHIGFSTNNKIYSTLSSEDKSKIIVFKINSRNKRRYIFTSMLLNDRLELQKRSRIVIPMEEKDDYLDEFHLDNEGDLVFTEFYRNNNDNIGRATFMMKQAQSDSFVTKELNIEKSFLDEIHIKVDNFNKRYFFTSFYYKQRRGNVDGFYFYIWDKETAGPIMEKTITFSEELRKEAKGDANIKMAFNDYFIRNIITKKDGGFILGSEAFYTTSRSSLWNRWDYLYGSPFMSPMDYYYYSPYYNSWWWRSRYSSNQSVRYHADNIVILSFSKEGNIEWSNVIRKEQFDDETDNLISYNLMNTGDHLHFLFNQEEKRVKLLNDYTIAPNGQINRNPTLKNLDRGYDFMAKYAKQVTARQMIVPCFYRNFICFAKIDYN